MLFGCATLIYPCKIIIVLFCQHGGGTGGAKDMSTGALAPVGLHVEPPLRTGKTLTKSERKRDREISLRPQDCEEEKRKNRLSLKK